MIRVPIRIVEEGSVLARSVTNPKQPESVLFAPGMPLDRHVIDLMRKVGIRSVWVAEPCTESLEKIVTEDDLAFQRGLLFDLTRTFRMIRGAKEEGLPVTEYQDNVSRLIFSCEDKPFYTVLEENASDELGTALHAVNVARLSLSLGRTLDPGLSVEDLALGALFHDIGKLSMPVELLRKPEWEITVDERAQLRFHARKGYQFLGRHLSADCAMIALGHHRMADGTGFPEDVPELQDEVDHEGWTFSGLVGLANEYDYLTSHSRYRAIEALEELACARPHHFHPALHLALSRIVPPYPPGSLVELNNKFLAVVLDFDPELPFAPRVMLLKDPSGKSIPASQRKGFGIAEYENARIVKSEGHPVGHLLPDAKATRWGDVI